MKNRLLVQLPKHKNCICSIYNPNLFIVDWKNTNGGKVEISGNKNNNINAVYLQNKKNIELFFDGFPENALPISKKSRCKQCECVTFPFNCNEEEWVLFIETKYAQNENAARNSRFDYPCCMVKQIKETVKYFREKGIISDNKIVHAIISFPNLVDNFNSWVFPITQNDKEESILDILINDKIIIRATNKAKIESDTELFLVS